MSFIDIENAITTYLDGIAAQHGLSIRYENDPRATPSNSIWLKCKIEYDDSNVKEIGKNKSYRTTGNLIIEVLNEIGLGTSGSLRFIDFIVAPFTEETISNSVKFRTPSVQNVGRVDDNYQINIICPFYVDN